MTGSSCTPGWTNPRRGIRGGGTYPQRGRQTSGDRGRGHLARGPGRHPRPLPWRFAELPQLVIRVGYAAVKANATPRRPPESMPGPGRCLAARRPARCRDRARAERSERPGPLSARAGLGMQGQVTGQLCRIGGPSGKAFPPVASDAELAKKYTTMAAAPIRTQPEALVRFAEVWMTPSRLRIRRGVDDREQEREAHLQPEGCHEEHRHDGDPGDQEHLLGVGHRGQRDVRTNCGAAPARAGRSSAGSHRRCRISRPARSRPAWPPRSWR